MTTSGAGRPESVDEYLAGFPDAQAERLAEIRGLCRAAAPDDAVETLKWGAPAYVSDTILFQFAGYRAHANLAVTPSTREAFADTEGYETGKGTLKLPYDAPLPVDLIRRILDHRVREWAERGVRWM